MSRRSVNRDRLSVAGSAAIATAGWVYADAQHDALVAALGPADAKTAGSALLEHARIAALFADGLPALIDLFAAYPKLARFMSEPDAFQSLIHHTGAVISGGEIASLVNRFDVSVLIANVGESAWRFGLEHAASELAPEATDSGHEPHAPLSADQIVATIEAEGSAAVHAFLSSQSPDLAASVFAAAGIGLAHRAQAQSDTLADATKMVLTVMERATP
jgi:hypothetical protein